MIVYKRVTSDEELLQILELQKLNIPKALSEAEKQNEGFVTVHHTFEVLQAMNSKCKHVIATYQNKVVGYALTMHPYFRDHISVLVPMFTEIDNVFKATEELKNYVVMGQICISKSFRKKGIFRGLYEFMKSELSNDFETIITEVDTKNTRSINAHRAIGFHVLSTYVSNQQEWELIYWDIQ